MDIIVLGNGFDLQCGLKSTYKDFFLSHFSGVKTDEIKSMVEYVNNAKFENKNYSTDFENMCSKHEFNFWDFVFLHKKINKKRKRDWSDVEAIIEQTLLEIQGMLVEIENSVQPLNNVYPNSKRDNLNFSEKLFLAYFINEDMNKKLINLKSNNIGNKTSRNGTRKKILEIYKKNNFYEVLLEDLKEFEGVFDSYLTNQMNKLSETYKQKSKCLLKKLCDQSENTQLEQITRILDSDIILQQEYLYKYYILNFNYTEPELILGEDNIGESMYNLHGRLAYYQNKNSEVDIIFGVNNHNLEEKKIKSQIFTKTYRGLYSKETNKLPEKEQVRNITFYGHSLSEADYAYFITLFNYYDLYNNTGITLNFCYTAYDIVNHEVININRAVSLLNKYSQLLSTDVEKDSLLTKLRLEGRIRFVKINNS